MKLLIVTQKVDQNDDLLGFFHDWIKEFAQHAQKITVICLEEGDYDLPKHVRVVSLGKEKNKNNAKPLIFKRLIYVCRFYCYILKYRKDYKYVFVHMNPEYVAWGGLVWRLMNKKIGLWFAHKSVATKLRLAEKFSHVVFSASKESFRLKSKKLQVVGHGINLNRFKNIIHQPNKIFQVISIGRISPIKDYETLIKAIVILKEKNIQVQVKIIGDAPLASQEEYFKKIKKLTGEKKLADNIEFIGAVPYQDISKHLAEADLFAHMSKTGSLDKVVLEAAAANLPVVSSNDSSMEFFGSLKNELYFNPSNAEELAKRIENISKMSIEDRQAISTQLQKTVSAKHSLETLINKIIKIYHGSAG